MLPPLKPHSQSLTIVYGVPAIAQEPTMVSGILPGTVYSGGETVETPCPHGASSSESNVNDQHTNHYLDCLEPRVYFP